MEAVVNNCLSTQVIKFPNMIEEEEALIDPDSRYNFFVNF